MPGIKRSLAHVDAAVSESVHPSRKRRVEYSEADAQLATTYNDLADEVPAVRLKAAGTLLKNLSSKSPSQAQRVHEALERLIRGLCSGRKVARLGFSIALCELLRLAFDLAYDRDASELRLSAVTAVVVRITQAEGKASGQEKREHLLGRRFALQAILQSNVAHISGVTDEEWTDFVRTVADLACQKAWLMTECGAMLYEYLETSEGKRLTQQRARSVVDALQQKRVLQTPEGVAIWLSLADGFAEVLPVGVWHKKDPLAPKERLTLKKVLHVNSTDNDGSKSGTRQSQPSFAWRIILSNASNRDRSDDFGHFWSDIVDGSLFATSSSAERKALGLQIVCIAVATVPASALRHVFGRNALRTIINQRAESSRYLFEAAKLPLDQGVARVKQEPAAAAELLRALVAEGAFDQSTKTKTTEAILSHAKGEPLQQVVSTLRDRLLRPAIHSEGQADSRRRIFADMLLTLVRAHRDPSEARQEGVLAPWLKTLLETLIEVGYSRSDIGTSPAVSEGSRSVFRARLMSCLGLLIESPGVAIQASVFVVTELGASQKMLHSPLSKAAREALKSAQQTREQMEDRLDNAALQAYRLLFDLSMLQVYSEERDSIEALQDLITSFQAREEGTESATMLVELLLSFVSKPSALFRKLTEQVFSTFADELTSESLQSLFDILQQKEGLSGQQALFDQGDDTEASSEDEEGDVDGVNVEDASDVELVSDEEADGSEAEASEEDDGASDSSSDQMLATAHDDGEDEEAAFDRKLADALGTVGMDNESDEDGSDMDDEQMLALEPHLANIFKERRKDSGKKQENKDAKENIVNFKNRVLDLLNIYVKSQYANVLALDLILPLTTLVRTTTSKPSAEKAFAVLKQYFEACNKHKSLPKPNDHEACFVVLSAVHEEMKLGGSKAHANACSRSSLFLTKMLVAVDPEYYGRVTGMYAELQSGWYLDPKSKVQGSVFTEWTSWSLATRKQHSAK